MNEQERILAEYSRRDREVPPDLYAPWNPAEDLLRAGRRRVAAALLRRAGSFPVRGRPVLEIGYGRLGWLAELLGWGLAESDLHGIELDPDRAAFARDGFPAADLRVGDASELPWPAGTFQLVVTSTLLSSILDPCLRRAVAAEVVRVLSPGGALLWYDFRFDNPLNRQVRGIGRRELRTLFAGLDGPIRSVSLAPPIARRIAPWSHWLATTLESLPFLRTHLVACLCKPETQ